MNSKSNLNKLGVKKSHRISIIKGILSDLVIFEHVKTTNSRAIAVAPMFDKAVKIAKLDMPRRELERKLVMMLGNISAANKLIDVFVKRFNKDKTGLVKLYKLGARKGDGAQQTLMIVKGYTYKEIGKKIETKKELNVEKEEVKKSTQKFDNETVKSGSQVMGKINTTTVKSRSGI